MAKKQNSSHHRYTGALATPLKPRQKRQLPYSWRRSRALRAHASVASAPFGAPSSSDSVPESRWALDLNSLFPSERSGAILASTSAAPTLPMFSDSLYSTPGWRWEFNRRLPPLFDHYGVAKDDAQRWERLCLGLAIAHVPGFQVRASRKKGRPHTMSPQDEDKLYARFCELRQGGQTDRNAAHLMAKELRKSGQAVGSEASILRRMQRRKQKALAASKALDTWLAGLAVTQNPTP